MTPAKILLLRHAEKPDDAKDDGLTAAGRVRAAKLAPFIEAAFGKPDFVFAAAGNKGSERAILTMRPLCDATSVALDSSLTSKDSVVLATRLLLDATFADKLVVVCWTHTELPALAGALGARRGEFPNPWGDTVFNLILELTYRGGNVPDVAIVIQPF